jgi:hypothetical protein
MVLLIDESYVKYGDQFFNSVGASELITEGKVSVAALPACCG